MDAQQSKTGWRSSHKYQQKAALPAQYSNTWWSLRAPNRHVIIKKAKDLLQKGDWLLKLDFKDAYLTVLICQEHQDFLKFQWQGKTCVFIRLEQLPHVYQAMKPVVALL